MKDKCLNNLVSTYAPSVKYETCVEFIMIMHLVQNAVTMHRKD